METLEYCTKYKATANRKTVKKVNAAIALLKGKRGYTFGDKVINAAVAQVFWGFDSVNTNVRIINPGAAGKDTAYFRDGFFRLNSNDLTVTLL